MRELKFRAWHTEQKRMLEVYAVGLDFITENTLDGVNPGTNAFFDDDLNDIVIMQYTSLKDKNGKEIYDGDILSWDYADSKELKNWMKLPYFKVCYEKDYVLCGVDIREGGNLYLYGFRFKFTDVIGNIYQNPELLNSKTTI